MGRGDALLSRLDESLALRISRLSPGSQRWLKTMLHAIRVSQVGEASEGEGVVEPEGAKGVKAPPERPPSLEDVITGQADLREHLRSYPELAEELEGLADIIDMLREAGEQRRRRGEKIFREEILGEPPEEDGEEPA